jgi:trans-aconitate methyltransferase
MNNEFDKHSRSYNHHHKNNLNLVGESSEYFHEYKIKFLKNYFKKINISPKQILDYGCGVGNSVQHLKKYFPDSKIICFDSSKQSIMELQKKHKDIVCFYGNSKKLNDYKFDLIFCSCVFHHVIPSNHIKLLNFLFKLKNKNSKVVIFEHNPYNPLTKFLVNNCPFDENAILISMRNFAKLTNNNTNFNIEKKTYHVFFPYLLRYFRKYEHLLGNLPIGGQYSLILS